MSSFLRKINAQKIYILFALLHIFVITIYLFYKSNEKLKFEVYLQTIKYSTLLLLVVSVIFIIKERNSLLKINKLKIAFVTQIFILYITMLLHTDIKVITSPTFVLMLLLFFIFSDFKIDQKFINKISIFLTLVNFLFAFLQVQEIIPVAQLNVRENLISENNRPTGIFFNAFAMSFASLILFLICLYFLLLKSLVLLNLLALILSFLSILLSATRTTLFMLIAATLLVIFQNVKKIYTRWKLITTLTIVLSTIFPILIIVYGQIKNIENYSTLNGRVLMWECVLKRSEEFLPFGVGVQAAFPKGFCTEDSWFGNLRHPENMFLLNFVESGLLGVLGLLILFAVSFLVSAHELKNKNALPLTITATFYLCSLFYVPLFHYVPFLENRPADRGIFNFLLLTLLWLLVLRNCKNKTLF